MNRIAFRMQLYKGQAEKYKRRHDNLWPELAALLKKNGIHDYSIFLDEESNSLFATMKIENVENINNMASDEIMKKWWKYMSTIMHTKNDNTPFSVQLKEVFYLK